MKKTCKIILAIFLLVTGILINPFLSYAGNDTETTDPGNLYALSAVLMDGTSGRVLYGKNADGAKSYGKYHKNYDLYSNSGTVQSGRNGKNLCICSIHAKGSFGSNRRRRHSYVKDLLYSLMLESHNDSAVILAEYLGGNVSDFAAKMNEKAKEIGCERYLVYYSKRARCPGRGSG